MTRSDPARRLLHALECSIQRGPLTPNEPLVVAFSGGPDSCALLWALTELRDDHGWNLVAAHLDHGLDADSPRRARRAGEIAADLDVDFDSETVDLAPIRGSREAAARRARYDYLERVRRRRDAALIVTAHHQDDQVETILLRLRYGTGIRGLRCIRSQRGAVVRPLLDLGRDELSAVLADTELEPVEDPTNEDLSLARNRVRHLVRPRLEREVADLARRLLELRAAAVAASDRVETMLERCFPARRIDGWPALERTALSRLPPSLQRLSLDLLHRRAGRPYPPSRAASSELLGQLDADDAGDCPGRVRCDCDADWAWECRDDLLVLRRPPEPIPPFAYNLQVPGSVEIAELDIDVSVTRQPVADWMRHGHPRRVGLDLPLDAGDELIIRNRRPGDRLRPLGMDGTRRLKEVFIDRKVPRERRDRLPIVCREGRIVCVPGVVVDDRARLRSSTHDAWVVEVSGGAA